MIYTITLGHVPSRIWELSLAAYKRSKTSPNPYKHFFLNQHYALDHNRNENENLKICRDNGVEWLDFGKNLGLHDGFNKVVNVLRSHYNLQDSDLILGYDPDSNPISMGWDMALETCFIDPSVAWASLYGTWLVNQFKHRERYINQIKVHETEQAIMNSICLIKAEFLRHTNGFSEGNKFYGGLEVAMWPHFERLKKKWVFCADYWEDHTFHHLQDEQYRNYKWFHVHQKWSGDFKSYVEAGCPIL